MFSASAILLELEVKAVVEVTGSAAEKPVCDVKISYCPSAVGLTSSIVRV